MILTDILQRFSIAKLNTMQEAMLAMASTDKDALLLAPTGSGKTLAFLLPLLEKGGGMNSELRAMNSALRVMILSPSRELTLQTAEVWKTLSEQAAATLYGGHELRKERQQLSQPAASRMIIGTPGRVADVIRRGHIDAQAIDLLIIDEFDKMLELGFTDVMSEILAALSNIKARWLVSATSTPEVSAFISSEALRLDYRNVQLFNETEARQNIYTVCSPQPDKLDTLRELLPHIALPAIVFVNHREAVERISSFLSLHKLPHTAFHGGMEQRVREKAMFMFRSLSSSVLISTDLVGRGIDIPEVSSVVHYHSPLTADIFTHRNGRATRGTNAAGTVYVLRSEKEKVPDYMAEQPLLPYESEANPKVRSAHLLSPNATLYISKGRKDKLSKGDIVGWLCKQYGLTGSEIVRIELLDHHAYAAIPRRKMQLVLAASPLPMKGKNVLVEEAH